MCSAGVVGRQDDDDWRTVDVVKQEHQTLACSSSLSTAVLFRAGIRTSWHQLACKQSAQECQASAAPVIETVTAKRRGKHDCLLMPAFSYRSRTKMAVTPYDQPWPKTLCCTHTSPLCVLWTRSYWRWSVQPARIRICAGMHCRFPLRECWMVIDIDREFVTATKKIREF